MDPVTLNNQMVLARPLIRRTKAFVNQKLCRKLDKLRGRSNGASSAKFKRKEDLLVEEIQIIKELKPDQIFKFAVRNDIPFENIVKQVKYSMDERALARLAEYPLLKKKLSDFKEKYSDWKSVADKYWDENRPKKLNRIKKGKKNLKNNALSNDQSRPKNVCNKKIKTLGDNEPIIKVIDSHEESKNIMDTKSDNNVVINEPILKVIDSSKPSKNEVNAKSGQTVVSMARNKRTHQFINTSKENIKKARIKDGDQDESFKDFEGVESEEINHNVEEIILKNVKHTKLVSKNKTLPKKKKKSSISLAKHSPIVNKEMAVMKIDVSKLTDEIILAEDLPIKANADSDSEEERPKSSFFISMNANQQVIPTKKAPVFTDEKGRPLNRKERRAQMRGESILPKKQPILPRKQPILPRKQPILSRKQPILPRKQPILSRKQPILSRKQISKPYNVKVDINSPNFIKIKHPATKRWVPKQEKESDSSASLPTEILHPSWEAKRLQKKQAISLNVFKGKKINFND